MDKELKAKWVDALRSGKYEQTTGTLRKGDGYCCLGVLCDVVGVEWQENKYDHSSADIRYTATMDDDWDGGMLPRSVMRMAGLNEVDPEVWYEGEKAGLSHFNDDCHLNFDTLADLIERQL